MSNLSRETHLTKSATSQSFHPPASTTGRSRRGSKAPRKSIDKFSIKHKISVRLRPRSAVSGGPSRKLSGSSGGLLPPRSSSPHQLLKPGFLSRPVTPIEPSSPGPLVQSSKAPEHDSAPPVVTPLQQEQQQSPPKQPTPRSSSNPESSSSSSESIPPSAPPRRPKSADNVSAPFSAPVGPRLVPQTQSSPIKPGSSSTVSEDADEAWRILRRKEFTLRIQEEVLKAGRRRLQQEREELERERRGFREERRRWWRERIGWEGRVRVAGKSRDREDAAGETDRTSWSEIESSDGGGTGEEDLGARSYGEDEDAATARPESLRSRSESETTYSSTASTESASGSTNWSRRKCPTPATNSKSKGTNDDAATTSFPPTSSFSHGCDCAASPSKSPRQQFPDQPHTYATYTLAWTSLAHNSAAIPFPTPTLLPDALLSTQLSANTTTTDLSALWPQETVIKQNAASFILAGHDISSVLASLPDASSPPPQSYIPAPTLSALSDKQLATLVSALRRELRRWHEDSLARRVGSEHNDNLNHSCAACPAGTRSHNKHDRQKAGGSAIDVPGKSRNEALVADERVRAVFRAFTELRDEVLTEVKHVMALRHRLALFDLFFLLLGPRTPFMDEETAWMEAQFGRFRCIVCNTYSRRHIPGRCFADTKLVCQDETFYTHRHVLTKKSKYFEELFSCRASNNYEPVQLDRMRDDFVIEALLNWIYKDELEPEEIYPATRAERATDFPRGNPAERQLRGYMLLWAAAEMFGVAGLKVDIWDQIRWYEVFNETPGRRDSLISLAIAFNILQDLYTATQDVPRGICARYLALRWVSEHSADLFRTPQFYDRALEHIPEFWCELRQFKTDEMERTRECPSYISGLFLREFLDEK
ncbi:uncharacterized protein IWZ02DRAFT_494965 [Phyllosticta citriasiana]|uniref:uncharacterized protein n=1 Tax=Phyllosticta citriasiana TaxID=595635 RepID=UPI0030FDCD68